MKRFVKLMALVTFIVVVIFTTRYVRHQRARVLALTMLWELGAKVGSITAPFGGTEYYVSFAGCSLTRDDIDRLVVLNTLASNWNYVSVSLDGAIISSEDLEYMGHRLSEVHVLPVETDAKLTPDT